MEWCVRDFNSDEEIKLDQVTSYALYDVKRVQVEIINGQPRATLLVRHIYSRPEN